MAHECERHKGASRGDLLQLTRRHFFNDCGVGLGKIALASLLTQAGARAATPNPQSAIRNPQSKVRTPHSKNPLAPKKPHFHPKAKAVIHLFMSGAPSQL